MSSMDTYNKDDIDWKRPVADDIDKINGQNIRGRASGAMERYLPEHGRMNRTDCEHTQILGKVFGLSNWCLDCGAVLDTTDRPIVSEPYLSDDDLVEKRRAFNEIWFDKTYKLSFDDPDDDEKEQEIAESLAKEGTEKL